MFYRVRDKIGMKDSPMDVNLLTNTELEKIVCYWIDLFKCHRILLSFNEVEINYKRRYLFISNVFLDLQLPVHPPELYFCFLYDHYEQNNFPEEPEVLVGGLLNEILGGGGKLDQSWIHKRVKLNQFHNLSEPELLYVIDCHQKKHTSISGISLRHNGKQISGNRLVMTGSHTTGICGDDLCTIHQGNWKVEMLRFEGNWRISGIFIEGIEF